MQQTQQHQGMRGNPSILNSLGVLMNTQTGRYDELVGRDKEVDQLIATLYQRKKPNPVLIGQAGVGKTQIVEGVVSKINNGEVSGKLAGAYIYQMDVKKLAMGLMRQGMSLVNDIIDELDYNLSEGHPTILFMDEMHLLVGGLSQSNVNAENPADVLKPALARGDIRVIGATTVSEYRNIEADKALERRFSPIFVDELTEEETLQVLDSVRDKYEEFHGVTYGEDVFETSIELASRYLPDRVFPDKAMDIIDKIGAKMSSTYDQEGLSHEEEILEYDGIVALLNMSRNLVNNNLAGANQYGREFEQVVESQEEYARQQDSERKLITKLDVKNFIKETQGLDTLIEEYTEEDIINEFKDRIVGQDVAIESVAEHMILANYGFKDTDKPKLSMLFYGSTGVGKTEVAKQISRIMFGTEEYISIDGGEYNESHTISKLVGSPAGYVGYGNPTPFDSLRRKPNQVILIDEFDKMHYNVKQLFLGVLEEGRMRDGAGKLIPFNETVIIFTTNEKPEKNIEPPTVGFSFGGALEEDNAEFLQDDRPKFMGMSPELINRFDEVVGFNDMTKEMVSRIFEIKFGDFQKTAYDEHGWVVNLSDTAKESLVKASFNPSLGARPINRVISSVEALVVKTYARYKATNNGSEKTEFNIVVDNDNNNKVNVL